MGVTTNDDIVWRIIEKRLFYGKTYHEISEDLLVPMTTVFDIVKRSSERASFATWQGARCSLPANATLDRRQRWLLLDLILEADDDTQLDELSDLFFKAEGIRLDVPFMSRTMLEMNLTHKSVSDKPPTLTTRTMAAAADVCCMHALPTVAQLALLAHERDAEKTLEKKLFWTSNYTLEQMVWIDEFGFGKSPRNNPQRCATPASTAAQSHCPLCAARPTLRAVRPSAGALAGRCAAVDRGHFLACLTLTGATP